MVQDLESDSDNEVIVPDGSNVLKTTDGEAEVVDEEDSEMGDCDADVKVYCRIRGLMPWEDHKLGVKWQNNQVINYGQSTRATKYEFSSVLGPEIDNDETFNTSAKPLVDEVIKGFHSILIAYGQTGSGKTYTMCGKPFTKNGKDLIGMEKMKVIGMISRSLQAFLDHPQVTEVRLKAIEVYGSHPSKIKLYDLFHEKNQNPSWNEKVGYGTMNVTKQATALNVVSQKDSIELIQKAHAASHYAVTSKNPDSSRGHIVFIADVTSTNIHGDESHTASMAFVDLAGSEGESALGSDFAQRVSQATLLARRLEAGCINMGLSDLQLIFAELINKGRLKDTSGRGLRRILKHYLHNEVHLAVIFTLSPAFDHCSASEATLKFAYVACQLKTSPLQVKKKADWPSIVVRLEKEIVYLKELSNSCKEETDEAKQRLESVIEANAKFLESNDSQEFIQVLEEADLMQLFDDKFAGRMKTDEQMTQKPSFGKRDRRPHFERTMTTEERMSDFLEEVHCTIEDELEFQASDSIIIQTDDDIDTFGDAFNDDMFSHDILSHEEYDNQVAEEFIEETGIGLMAFSENPTILELSTANTILKMKLKIEQIMSGRADPTEMIHDAFDLMDKNGDGLIDRDEFKDVVDSLAIDLEDTDLNELFDKVDEDKNGVLDKQEVRTILIPELVKLMGGANPAQIQAKVQELQREAVLHRKRTVELGNIIEQIKIEKEKLRISANNSAKSAAAAIRQLQTNVKELQVNLEEAKQATVVEIDVSSDTEMILKGTEKIIQLDRSKVGDAFVGVKSADQIHMLLVVSGRICCIFAALCIIASAILGIFISPLIEAIVFFTAMLILGGGVWMVLSKSILAKLLKNFEVYQILFYWTACCWTRSDDVLHFLLFGLSLVLGSPLIAFVDAAPRELTADLVLIVGSSFFIYFSIITATMFTSSKDNHERVGAVHLSYQTIYVFCAIHLMLILGKTIGKFCRDSTRFLMWKSSLRIEQLVFFE